MPKPIVAVDIDDVLADSTEALRLEVNQRLGVDLTQEHYKAPRDHYWGYYESIWEEHGLADRISLHELEPQMETEQGHLLPFADSFKVLKALSQEFELIIVTGRNSSWRAATERWLEQHYPGLFSKVLFGEGKEGLSRKGKGEICAEEGVSWLIDDNVEHASTAFERGVKVVLFGQYGWHHQIPKDMVQCRDWQAVKEFFDGLK